MSKTGSSITYGYNADGKCISRTVNGTTCRQLQPHDGPDLQKRQHLLPQKCLIYKTGITAYLSYI